MRLPWPTDPDDEKKSDYGHLMDDLMASITIPAVLYFPLDVLGQLNELCLLRRLTPAQLIVEAIKSQDARFEEFITEVWTPLKPGEPEIWPEDPLKSLACVLVIHLFRVLHQKLNDPAGFKDFQKKRSEPMVFQLRRGTGRRFRAGGLVEGR